LFFLAEYAALFAMSSFNTAFFFGGYYAPTPKFILEYVTGQMAANMTGILQLALQSEMLFWFMLKTFFFIFMAMWIRATLPRLKPDQLMGFSWKFLIPLSLLNIFFIAIQKYLIAPGQSVLADLPILKTSSDVTGWAISLVVALVVFGIFFT